MSASIPVFVNERVLSLPIGSTALDAVTLADPALAALVADGSAAVTDARGLPADVLAPLPPGAILRVTVRARRAGGTDADG